MENITTDIHELEKGMEMTKREYDLRRNSRDQLIILRDFLANSEEKLRKLLSDVKTAQVKFKYTVYSKTCLERPLKSRQNKGLK